MKRRIALLLIVINCIIVVSQETSEKTTSGYKNGTLIVIGGGAYTDLLMSEFKKNAGGDSAKIVVIPTASEDKYINNDELEAQFKKYGFNTITVLHTRDRATANSEEFINPIQSATGIFFTGGRQWRIADGFLNTKAHREMFNLLDRGGVIAGSSAGATIQGSYLARGDSKNNQIMMGDHEEGLGFISNVAIDQHVMVRNRQFDMFDILDKRPELLGIGIDERTAIVVKGEILTVVGDSYVLVYDRTFWSREGSDLKNLPDENEIFYFLRSGDRYNLKERKVINNITVNN